MFNKKEFRKLRVETGLEWGYSRMNQEQFAVYLMSEIPTLKRMSQKKISRWESGTEKYGGTPKHYELCQLSHWIAGKYGTERAIAITGLEPDQAFNVPIRQKVVEPPSRKIIMVTYESGVVRWFPHTTDTLNQIVSDFDSIKEVAIIEQGGEQ